MPPSTWSCAAAGAAIGMLDSAASELSRYCGVCITIRIGNAVGGIEPVGRRHLAGAREIDDHASW